MGKRCAVAGCGNSSKTGHSVNIFPKDDKARHLWIRFVKLTRADFIAPTQHSAVCSAHFTEDCYEVERLKLKELFGMSTNKRLLPNSVPSIYLKRPSTPDALNEGFLGVPKKKTKISTAIKKGKNLGLILAALHFNENASRPQTTTEDGTARYSIHYPKYKKGGYIAREIKTDRTFQYVETLLKLVSVTAERKKDHFVLTLFILTRTLQYKP